jgi:hypothetical protein
MASIKTFEELESWKTSRELCKIIGRLIDSGHFRENYALIKQIDGSSGSIMDNIAEGFERGSKNEFILFLGYSRGSCAELRSQIIRAADRGYITAKEANELSELTKKVSAMNYSLIRYLRNTQIEGVRNKVTKPKP